MVIVQGAIQDKVLGSKCDRLTFCPSILLKATVGVGVGVLAPWQVLILLVSKVTAPLRAYRLPLEVAEVVAVMDVNARMLPAKLVPVPKVAELPTCQKMLHALAPFVSTTLELLEVTRVVPVWKMKTPGPLSVSCPVKKAEVSKQYTPAVSVLPPRSWPVKLLLLGQVSPAAVA